MDKQERIESNQVKIPKKRPYNLREKKVLHTDL